MTMIQAEQVSKRHGSFEVLRSLSLSVNRGEVAVIIGPSGGGKSTFLRCLNGLDSFQSGSITIDGLRLDPQTPSNSRSTTLRQIRRNLGMVFQGFNLFPHLCVLKNVTLAPIQVLKLPPQEAEARARALLDRVGLLDKLHAMPSTLSGGQQQRVAIARALAMQPQGILFDEPTSALDPRMTAEVLAVLSDLARDGLTMLVATHAMRFARQAAHTIHVLDQGRLIESGPPSQIFDAPLHEATRNLLAETQTNS